MRPDLVQLHSSLRAAGFLDYVTSLASRTDRDPLFLGLLVQAQESLPAAVASSPTPITGTLTLVGQTHDNPEDRYAAGVRVARSPEGGKEHILILERGGDVHPSQGLLSRLAHKDKVVVTENEILALSALFDEGKGGPAATAAGAGAETAGEARAAAESGAADEAEDDAVAGAATVAVAAAVAAAGAETAGEAEGDAKAETAGVAEDDVKAETAAKAGAAAEAETASKPRPTVKAEPVRDSPLFSLGTRRRSWLMALYIANLMAANPTADVTVLMGDNHIEDIRDGVEAFLRLRGMSLAASPQIIRSHTVSAGAGPAFEAMDLTPATLGKYQSQWQLRSSLTASAGTADSAATRPAWVAAHCGGAGAGAGAGTSLSAIDHCIKNIKIRLEVTMLSPQVRDLVEKLIKSRGQDELEACLEAVRNASLVYPHLFAASTQKTDLLGTVLSAILAAKSSGGDYSVLEIAEQIIAEAVSARDVRDARRKGSDEAAAFDYESDTWGGLFTEGFVHKFESEDDDGEDKKASGGAGAGAGAEDGGSTDDGAGKGFSK